MKPIIGRDVFFVQRQLFIESLQSKGDNILDVVLLVVLGCLITACLMAW